MSDFASMKIADLKKELKAKGLPMSGNKQELVDRLQQAESSALLDDDLDHEDEQISEEAIKAAEEELKKQTDLNTSDEPSPAKKLKTSDDKENTIEAVTSPVKADGTPEKATSPVEVLKARAERFGVQSELTKKAARAERFGVASAPEGAEEKKSKKIGDAPPVDIDILKKRAERFGSTVSPHVKQAEISDAIKKRQERFGVVTKPEKGPAVKTNLGTNSVVLDEKLLKRKERFNM